MSEFVHERHKFPTKLNQPRELIVACVPMRSNVNISQIARTASACAVEKMIICGNASLISKIARDATSALSVSTHRSLKPVLKKLKQNGYHIVGIEQASNSKNIHHFAFKRRMVLVIGNERLGINDEILEQLDEVIEIPVWGLPHSYNAASAANMALYEYCRQFPQG